MPDPVIRDRSLEAAGRKLVDLLEQNNKLLEAVLSRLTDILVIVGEAIVEDRELPDEALPFLPDGTCERCGSVKVQAPDERPGVRVCGSCRFAWRVEGEVEVQESDEGGES